ncbi:MAG: phosphoglycerate kinase [Parachlamydia sp.]|jgi:phosphoglycerate kinase|nr:phosphoglycerate kinase [Parachlamydia sp.]
MFKKLSNFDVPLKGEKVLMRVDFNVPMEKQEIKDDTRIKASLPSIQSILTGGGSVILMSHLGRPKGKPDLNFSLKPCADRLSELLQRPVKFVEECVGPQVETMVRELNEGEVLLLENLRFHKGEEKPEEEPGFTEALAKLGTIYINDAFGTAHRSHASTVLIARHFPGRAAAGLLLEKEITYLGSLLTDPKRPFCALLGGAKISTKFKVIEALMQKADQLLIGGAMAYTFFKAKGYSIGRSLYEEEFVEAARMLLTKREESSCQLVLPIDVIAAEAIRSDAKNMIVNVEKGIPEGFEGVDIGPLTIEAFQKELKKAGTIFWNGPVGVFECPPFDAGTKSIARLLAELTATTIVGGGDSIAALEEAGVADRMTHCSTGGGASLEFIEYGTLPGIEALSERKA